jgi:hypothetical protein
MTDTVATEDREQPAMTKRAEKLIRLIEIPAIGLHQGQRTFAPHE